MPRSRTRGRLAVALLVGALLARQALAQGTPSVMSYQGRLRTNGAFSNDVTGNVAMTFAIFPGATGGSALWSESWPAVACSTGFFSVLLGSNGSPLPASVFAGGATRFLEVTVGGQTLTPRQQLGSVPFAGTAETAQSVPGGVTTSNVYNDPNWIGSLSAAKVSGKVASASSADTIAGGFQGDVNGPASSTKVVGLQNRTLAATAPAAGQGLGWNAGASRWEPMTFDGSGGTVTSVSATPPLSVTNPTTAPNISITSPLPVANGGTGATTQTWVDLTSAQTIGGAKAFAAQVSLPANGLVAGTNQLVVSGGNVGVGTAAPGQKLSVAGTIQTTSGGVMFPDGTVQTTAATEGIYAPTVVKDSLGSIVGTLIDYMYILDNSAEVALPRVRFRYGGRTFVLVVHADRLTTDNTGGNVASLWYSGAGCTGTAYFINDFNSQVEPVGAQFAQVGPPNDTLYSRDRTSPVASATRTSTYVPVPNEACNSIGPGTFQAFQSQPIVSLGTTFTPPFHVE